VHKLVIVKIDLIFEDIERFSLLFYEHTKPFDDGFLVRFRFHHMFVLNNCSGVSLCDSFDREKSLLPTNYFVFSFFLIHRSYCTPIFLFEVVGVWVGSEAPVDFGKNRYFLFF